MPVVLISGGTGLIGTKLTHLLIENNYEVIILSGNKNKSSVNPNITYSFWNSKKQVIDAEVIRKADHILHLAGAGVMDKKWSRENKKEIIESRTKSSELLIKTLKENEHHVQTFVSASAIGWYGADNYPLLHKDGFIESDPAAKDFLGETCVLWETSVEPVADMGIRLVKLRTGIVLSNDGGAFKEFKKPLRFGFAVILGSGKQVISWIHIEDICRIYLEAIENKSIHGSYNSVAPSPVSNKKLIIELAERVRHKFYIPIHIPIFFLKLFMGKRSAEILKSATVGNKKIKSTGFTFLYPVIESAIEDLALRKYK
jgi:uncharacterized protein (TIGR01777 family)